MKKKFNNEHTPKSSENCDKYSKSVSVEKLLQISPVLRLVKVLGLAAVLSLNIVSESLADCERPTNGICKTLGEKGTCGEGCSYTYDSATQTVYITATGDNAKIAGAAFHNYYYENNSMPAQTFIINGAIKIGSNAFNSPQRKLISGAGGALILTGVNHDAFGNDTTLSGTIIIPEGTEFAPLAFYGVTLADNAKIYCGVEDCKQKMIDSCNAWGRNENGNVTSCLNAVNNMGNKLLPYPENCLKVGAMGCTKCKNSNFKLNDGECDRLRYTPAEAAEVLHNDNTNSVTITFKK